MNRKNIRNLSLEDIAVHALLNFGFTPYFDHAAISHAKRLHAPIPSKKDNIKDLRNLDWSSIDNIDSQDLDQVEYCVRHPQEAIHVKVAIADVDHFVHRGDAIDKHASHNATSLYTGVHTFPMLPEQLSYKLSSLMPGEDKLAIVVEYNVKKDGQVTFGDVYRAWVNNKSKLVYEQVSEWLKDRSYGIEGFPQEIQSQVLLQYEAAKRLQADRQKQGMLEFKSIEPKAVIIDGKIKEMTINQVTEAHKIIEQFMIAANQTMIHFLGRNNVPTIQRIVRNPERWGRIVEIAQEYGFSLPAEPENIPLREFLMSRSKKSPETFVDLSTMIIKLIGRGEYEVVYPGKHSLGHFGLAVSHYTHSTAPNRRYVDLVIQRLVKSCLEKSPVPYTKRELVEQAAWCTERDTTSKKLERFMRKVAAAILLQNRVGDEFEGIITGSSPKGVYVRLMETPAEGRIMKGERGLDVGQKVVVRLIQADPLKGYLDFAKVKLI